MDVLVDFIFNVLIFSTGKFLIKIGTLFKYQNKFLKTHNGNIPYIYSRSIVLGFLLYAMLGE